jgi:hypothetical protein
MTSPQAPLPLDDGVAGTPPQSHDFEAQKQIHQQIRNDPDYDDWEYGTEPLPHEAWLKRQAAPASADAAAGPAL